MSTLSRRTFSLSAVGLLSGGLLAACGTESDAVQPTVTRIPDAANAPSTNTPSPVGASPAAGTPAASASTPVPPSDSGPQPAGGGAASPPAVTGVQASPTSATINMLDQLVFDPAEVTVQANVDVTLNIVNAGVLQHGYNIDAISLASSLLDGGGSEQVTINVPPGTYDSYCPVPGHKEAGMIGKLIAQ